MKAIISDFELSQSIIDRASENWLDATDSPKGLGVNKPFGDGTVILPSKKKLNDFVNSGAAAYLYNNAQINEVLNSDLMQEINASYLKNDTEEYPNLTWSAHDLFDFLVGDQPLYTHEFIFQKGREVKDLYLTMKSELAFRAPTGKGLTLFDISISNNFVSRSTSDFDRLTILDMANIYGMPEKQTMIPLWKKQYKNMESLNEIYDYAMSFSEEGCAMVWIKMAHWKSGRTLRVTDVEVAEDVSHRIAIRDAYWLLRHGMNNLSDINKFLIAGYTAQQLMPYVELGLKDYPLVTNAIDKDIDAELLKKLNKSQL